MPNRACDDRVLTVSLRFIRRFASFAGALGLSSDMTNGCRVTGDRRRSRVLPAASPGWELMDAPAIAWATGEFAAGGMKPMNRLAGGSIHVSPGQFGWAY
jgi:hypothetical protein